MTGSIRKKSASGGRDASQAVNPLRSPGWGVGLAWVLWLAGGAGTALGQETGGGGVRVESSGRSYTLEALVVAVFLGLALFSVCRSSRRV